MNIDWRRIREQITNPDGPVRRMWPLWIIFVVAFWFVLDENEAKAGLTIYGIGKVALGGIVGYVVDLCVFRPGDRPHLLTGIERGTAWKRRAWIVCAALIAMALVP